MAFYVVGVYILSLVFLFVILFKFKEPLYAILASTIIFGVLTYSTNFSMFFTDLYKGILSPPSLRIYLLIFMAFYLASLLKDLGLLDSLTQGFSSISNRLAAILVPSSIGLIPMPGGALVSAVSARDLYFKVLKICKEFATYINYWFRHIWVPSWPLYQQIILAAIILDIGIYDVIGSTYIGTLVVITLIPLVISLLPKLDSGKKNYVSLLNGIWIFIIMSLLVILFRLSLEYVLIIAIAMISLFYKTSIQIHKNAFKFALKLKIYAIIAFSLVFKEFILTSGADKEFINLIYTFKVNPYLAAFLIPFSAGLISSSEYIFVGVSFPILYSLIIVNGSVNHIMLLISYIAGWQGAMLSPLHLCLILTADYYKVDLTKTYRYLIPSSLYVLSLTYLIVF